MKTELVTTLKRQATKILAELLWTEPALTDLEEIAEYIALENPSAARKLVQHVFSYTERLKDHPKSGRRPLELQELRYREVVSGPCRIFYRYSRGTVLIPHVMRSERELRNYIIEDRNFRTD